jgi:hypothetical protein
MNESLIVCEIPTKKMEFMVNIPILQLLAVSG